jgi:molybdopterin converting factor small subunit
MKVTVEFFGIPRQRAGVAELVVEAGTVAEALAAVERACPRLAGLVRADGQVAPEFLLSWEGQRFTRDLGARLRAGDRLLILSADAGG